MQKQPEGSDVLGGNGLALAPSQGHPREHVASEPHGGAVAGHCLLYAL